MTIICFDHERKLLLVDTMASFAVKFGRKPVHNNKVRARRFDGVRVVAAASGNSIGSGLLMDRAIEAMIEGKGVFDLDLGMDDPDMSVIVMSYSYGDADSVACSNYVARGRMFVEYVDESHTYDAIGCGSDWYVAYRALGMGHVGAFLATCDHHQGCGLSSDALKDATFAYGPGVDGLSAEDRHRFLTA